MQAILYVMIVLDACVVIAEILLDLHAMRSKFKFLCNPTDLPTPLNARRRLVTFRQPRYGLTFVSMLSRMRCFNLVKNQ